MTKPRNSKTTIEDQLAEFTDRILDDRKVKQDEATFAPDPDLRSLEQTAQHLKNTFGNDGPDEIAIQRMRNNIIEGWKKEGNAVSESFWQKLLKVIIPSEQKWQSQQSRQRLSIAVSLAVLVVLMLISIPFLDTTGSVQPAASGQNLNALVIIAFGGLILLALWFFRRKP